MKGQSSVEYITLLIGFLMMSVPIVLFLLSYSSATSYSLKAKQLEASVNILKANLEEAFADCPTRKAAVLSLPDMAVNISLRSDYMGEFSKPYIEVHSKRINYVKLLDIDSKVSRNLNYIEAFGSIHGGGLHYVLISCNISEDSAGKTYARITLNERGVK